MKECLFTQSEAVAALNRVEGFDPMSLARRIDNEGQEQQLYLDVKYRKLWFRLVHPFGKIVSRIVSFTDNMAVVEALIYLDRNDPVDSYVAKAFSQKFRSEDPQFGSKFLEMAETAAVGRALSDAGFGLQFADVGEENDPEQTEAGIPVPGNYTQKAAMPENPIPNGNTGTRPMGTGLPAQDMQSQGSGMMREFYQQAQSNGSVIGQPAMGNTPVSGVGNTLQQNPQWGMNQQMQGQAPSGILDQSLPVQELVQRMNYEQATQVVVSMGKYKGKTMGQVAMEDPGILDWYVNTYQGNNHLIPAAAQVILGKALPMAG